MTPIHHQKRFWMRTEAASAAITGHSIMLQAFTKLNSASETGCSCRPHGDVCCPSRALQSDH